MDDKAAQRESWVRGEMAMGESVAARAADTVKLADVLETIEWQTMRWEAGSPELAAARVILSTLRLRYGVPAPEEE